MKRFAALATLLLLTSTPALARNEHDDDFVDAMIMHHRHGVEMAQMAVQKAHHAELHRLAQKMVDEQEKEIRDLETMRDTSETRQRPELADMPGMVGMDMSWLQEKSGNDFDLAFLTAMSEHHLGGIRMSRDEIASGSDPKPKAMARKIVDTQSRERRTMLQWRAQWSR